MGTMVVEPRGTKRGDPETETEWTADQLSSNTMSKLWDSGVWSMSQPRGRFDSERAIVEVLRLLATGEGGFRDAKDASGGGSLGLTYDAVASEYRQAFNSLQRLLGHRPWMQSTCPRSFFRNRSTQSGIGLADHPELVRKTCHRYHQRIISSLRSTEQLPLLVRWLLALSLRRLSRFEI